MRSTFVTAVAVLTITAAAAAGIRPVKLVKAASLPQYLTAFATVCPGHGTPDRGECFGPGQQFELGACAPSYWLPFHVHSNNLKFECARGSDGSATVKVKEFQQADVNCTGTPYANHSYVSNRCYRGTHDPTTCFALECPN